MFSPVNSAQVRKERDLLQARLEAAEAELERERGVHRRELRRRAKEQQEVRTSSCSAELRLYGPRPTLSYTGVSGQRRAGVDKRNCLLSRIEE